MPPINRFNPARGTFDIKPLDQDKNGAISDRDIQEYRAQEGIEKGGYTTPSSAADYDAKQHLAAYVDVIEGAKNTLFAGQSQVSPKQLQEFMTEKVKMASNPRALKHFSRLQFFDALKALVAFNKLATK